MQSKAIVDALYQLIFVTGVEEVGKRGRTAVPAI